MREDEILADVISDTQSATPSGYDVRLRGGDQDANPPAVILRWNSVRLPNANGHKPIGGFVTDNNGNKTGIEDHAYFRMEINCLVRDTDEIEKDKTADSLQMAFLPYERDAAQFDSDTREWEISDIRPRSNQVLEPDWYESGVVLTFEYVKRTTETDTVDYLQQINTELDVNSSTVLAVESGDSYTVDANTLEEYQHVAVEGTLTVNGILRTTSLGVSKSGTVDVNGSLDIVDSL